MSTNESATRIESNPLLRVPGSPGVWLFLFVEMTTFGLLFLGYSVSYRLNPQLFAASQQLLQMHWGVINTLLLLTSGLAMALAVSADKDNHRAAGAEQVRRCLAISGLVASGYLILKFTEWVSLYSQDITLSSNSFFAFYYFLTVFHWLHLLLGMIFLFIIRKNYAVPDSQAEATDMTHSRRESLESLASYWHMVDALWITLFLLVYVI